MEGAHTRGYNSVAHGFCIIGNFVERVPDDLALNTAQALLNCGMDIVSIFLTTGLQSQRKADKISVDILIWKVG